MDSTFGGIYKGKRVLLTGHTGFKGSWLTLWLQELGAEVIGYSIGVPTHPSHAELLNLQMVEVIGDILDEEKIFTSIKQYQPDIVFHLAAQAIVRTSYRDPVRTFATNVMGTANVLEACRKTEDVKAIVNITSDKCYQNRELPRGYTEEDPMGGDDPYSASKGAAEVISQSFRKSFFNLDDYGQRHHTLLANVRAGNVVGGGDWAQDRLIPDIMRAASQSQTVTVRNPQAVRPWQHVLEPLSGYLHLGWRLLEGKKEFADNWNFGPLDGTSLSVEEVLNIAKQHWDKITHTVEAPEAHMRETSMLMLDSTKARKDLHWQSIWDTTKTFAETIEWYKSFYTNNKVLSLDDLQTYVTDAKAAKVEWAIT